MSNSQIVNMRVTANSSQGHRKYMEDCYKIRFQRESSLLTSHNKALLNAAQEAGFFERNAAAAAAASLQDQTISTNSDILFSYFGIFDGHGGKEASQFAKEKLYWKIVEQADFWSDDDSRILDSIRNGFVSCHMDMWQDLSNWPKTSAGHLSTSGSTATILFIKKNKAYVGHVGDSGLVIGFNKNATTSTRKSTSSSFCANTNTGWRAKKLTRDHKPEDPIELRRIESMGGSVMSKSGVNRVVWNRPVLFNSGVKHSNTIPSRLNEQENSIISANQSNEVTERIPFLAVARSLGDLWSYDSKCDDFIVSPVPDVFHFEIDPLIHKCIILATDGLWNVMRASEAVELVRRTDKDTQNMLSATTTSGVAQPFVNPSQCLVNLAVQRCCEKMIRADNTTCITIMIDEPEQQSNLFSDDDLDIDETIIRSSSLARSKLIANLNQEDEDEEDDIETYKRKRNEKKIEEKRKKFNQTTSTMISSEINKSATTTPLFNNKRSKSLVSLRRRHWSASSNRSTATTDDDRRRRRSSQTTTAPNQIFYNNSNTHLNKTFSDQQSMQSCRIRISRTTTRTTTTTLQIKQKQESGMDKLSSTFVGISKFSKNLRKSFNDIYSASSNNNNNNNNLSVISRKKKNEREAAKENFDDKSNEESLSSRYAKRLKKLKNRLIQTKKSLFSRKVKKQTFGIEQHKSMPELSKIVIDDNEEEVEEEEQNVQQLNKTNASFVSSFKSKLGSLKRQHLKTKPQKENMNCSKRPRFF